MPCLIYITVPDQQTGETIAQTLLDKKLIACANLMQAGKSFYIWEGKTTSATEYILFLKTLSIKFKEVQQEILALHPYECPAIISWKIDQGHPVFLEWIGLSLV